MELTKRGIAYNLNISPHRLDVPYDVEGVTLTFVFSSDLYRKKFYDRFLDNREQIGASLSKRFGFQVESDMLSDVRLYSMIEKRGFLILKGEDKIVCRENIIFGGVKLMNKS